MKYLIFAFFCLLLVVVSCESDDNETQYYDAVVVKKGLDCGDSFLVKLDESVSGFESIDNTFYEINLPNNFKIENKELRIQIRKPKNDEYLICTTLGSGYSSIFVVSALSR